MKSNQISNGIAWVSAKAAAAYNGCHWMLSAGSAFMIYKVVINNGIEQGFPIWAVTALAWVIAAVWYQAVEHTLKVVMPFAVAYLLASKEEKKVMTKEERRTGRTSVFVSVVLLTATGGLSFFINPHISKSINKVEDSSVEIAESESVRNSYNNDIAIYQQQIASAEKADQEAIEKAKETGNLWVINAQNAGGANLGNLIRKGNGWALMQLTPRQRKKIETEKARADKHVQKAIAAAKAPLLQEKLAAYMEQSGSARDKVAMATMTLIETRQGDYEDRVASMNYTLFFVVLATLFLFVFMCFLMVNARLSRGEEIVDDDSPGVFKVVKKSALALNKKWGAKLAEKWKVDFVSTPPEPALAFVGTVSTKSALEPAENSLPSGFQREKSEPAPAKVSTEPADSQGKVSAPPPPGFANPPKVNAGFWVEEAVAYRKRVYGWWNTAHNPKKALATREDNRAKAEDAFVWFKSQGCTVTKKEGGKVSIKFPKL